MTDPFLPIADEILSKYFVVERIWDQADPTNYLKSNGPRIRGIATTASFGSTDAALLDLLPNVEIIASFGVGYDHVDAEEAARRGIVVTNTPGVLDEEVADLAIGLTLATLRRI